MLGVFAAVHAPVWALLVCIVLLTVAPFILMLYALRHLAATIVVVVATLEPVGAIILGWAWLGETLSAPQVLGCAAVLTGIVLGQTARQSPAHTLA